MKVPSDAQAALLSCVHDHEQDGEYVLAYEGGDARTTTVGLVLERDDHGRLMGVQHFVNLDPGLSALVPASLEFPRKTTFDACVRNEWLDISEHTVQVTSQRIGRCFTFEPKTYELGQIHLTEDGLIALGVWRQRKLAQPVVVPVLDGRDRDIVSLTVEAARLGYKVVPANDDARKEARRLARTEWVRRGYTSASTKSIEPTSAAVVECAPELADAV